VAAYLGLMHLESGHLECVDLQCQFPKLFSSPQVQAAVQNSFKHALKSFLMTSLLRVTQDPAVIDQVAWCAVLAHANR
jgi:hypothetical protein